MGKILVIRHSDDNQEVYQASLKKNEDGSYTADFGKADIGYNNYIKKYGKHFSPKLFEYAIKHIQNGNNTDHSWNIKQVENQLAKFGYVIPDSSTISDIAYTANMAYADFYPQLLTEDNCIKYAMMVANDVDGYEGIQFCRWISDQMGKDAKIDWDQFI